MPDITVERDYAISPSFLFDAIRAGSLFVAAGADRTRIDVDAVPGGGYRVAFGPGFFPASPNVGVDGVVTGVFTTVAPGAPGSAPATIAFTWRDDTSVTVDDRRGRGGGTRNASPMPASRAATSPTRSAAGGPKPCPRSARGRSDPRGNWPERVLLEDYLDAYRRIVVWKVRDLSETDARRRLVPSLTTLLGLVKHLTGVERNWFQVQLAQRDRADVGPNNRGSDESWELDHGRDGRVGRRRIRGRVHRVTPDRRAVRSGRRRAERATRPAVAPSDLRAHDRGDRSARRSRRHPSGAY